MSALAYLILLTVALMACALGAVGAYFYYRARHREAVLELEALDQDLTEREEEIRRLQYQFTTVHTPGAPGPEAAAEIQKIREELEQKKIDYNILKQDFDLETGILKQEVEQLRKERSEVDKTRRHVARKESELDSLEAELSKRKAILEAAEAELASKEEEADLRTARLRADVDRTFAAREEELTRQHAARKHDLDQRQRDLDAVQRSLREREEQVDELIGALPQDKFTSREEAMLTKRLRQQIKLQREELEHLHTLYRRLENQLEGHRSQPLAEKAREPETRRPAAGFPPFSTISSYMPEEKSLDGDRLSEIPGIDGRLEQELNALGIKSFDQVARLSSADVRRIAERLGVDRQEIQDIWIVAAQSQLFARS